MKTLLLGFSSESEWGNDLQKIREVFRPPSPILIFHPRYGGDERWITFNTEYNFKGFGMIRIHRKKETNTIFSVDALNALAERDGVTPSKDYLPNWEEFHNSLLLMRGGELNIQPTALWKRIDWE